VRVLVHNVREEPEGSTGSQSPPLDCTGASLITLGAKTHYVGSSTGSLSLSKFLESLSTFTNFYV